MDGETINPVHGTPFVPRADEADPRFALSPEEIPNVEDLVIEDGKPVDNMFVEKQYVLLTESLHSSWKPRDPFVAVANVGLFYTPREPPLVPDVMLSLGVPTSRDFSKKENRSYFLWILGKPPDAVIEIVSDRRGGEDTDKLNAYARIGVTYYVIFDPRNRLHGGPLRVFSLRDGKYHPIEASWLENVGLGLKFWEGEFQGQQGRWLRWCDRDGAVIPTGHESSVQEKQRAEQEKQRAEQEKQRAEQEKQRAEQEKQRAEQEKQRAEQEKQRADRLAAQLRALGIEPST